MAKKTVTQVVRALHRDIGFLMIGITVIYCVSGILLLYRGAFDVHEGVDLFIRFHKLNSKSVMHWFAAIYAVLLLFLTLSSFWMYPPKSTFFKRGLILTGAGILLAAGVLFGVSKGPEPQKRPRPNAEHRQRPGGDRPNAAHSENR